MFRETSKKIRIICINKNLPLVLTCIISDQTYTFEKPDYVIKKYKDFETMKEYQEYIDNISIDAKNNKKERFSTFDSSLKRQKKLGDDEIVDKYRYTLTPIIGDTKITSKSTKGTTLIKNSEAGLRIGVDWTDIRNVIGANIHLSRVGTDFIGSSFSNSASKISVPSSNLVSIELYYQKKLGPLSYWGANISRSGTTIVNDKLVTSTGSILKMNASYMAILLGDKKLGLYTNLSAGIGKASIISGLGLNYNLKLGLTTKDKRNSYDVFGGIGNESYSKKNENYSIRKLVFGVSLMFD